ncbi:MAG: SDR family oxidoreductase [Deltaproteobacteria bacterium]|nr:SDR family oxidoreductase [Deltaproteobacteria bacterium]MBK8238961.1 SDR family oxidoreductase [Deltaproteobacteria bacterium]MBK8717478.1 SDR family oxidoreductase [Deltaproteobacteria bacterium]MBP7289604.1 SDR family oxidoreductase [Nannocystaceae bacterium]
MPYRSVFRSDLFAGRTVIVTGGGSGIGRCTAHELAALGAHVVLVGRKPERLAGVAAELAEDGGACSSHACDIRDELAVREMIAAVVAARGRIDALVNNAGGQFPSPMALINQKGFETVVRTNLVGGFLVARECFTQSMRDHGGAIVNIVADMWNGMPGMAHSGAARAGMVNLTQTAALEWAPAGVRVNAVAPGWVASSGLDTYEGPIKQMIPKLREAVPLKRLATEAEISAAIVFLLSDAAAFITGETLKVDGGAPLTSALWPTPDHDRSRPFEGFHRAVVPSVLDRKGGAA